jgi:hypothetical protein
MENQTAQLAIFDGVFCTGRATRSLFRRGYEGTTLREHLGLPRPRNRFFP